MSCYSVESVYLTLFDNEWLTYTVTQEDLPFLTTTYLDKLFSGLVDKYGKDQAMEVEVSAYKSPSCVLTEG